MPPDFSDPLTSAAYASSKTQSIVDPLTSSTSTKESSASHGQGALNIDNGSTNQTNATAGAHPNVSTAARDDPLTMPASSLLRDSHSATPLATASASPQQQKSVSLGASKRPSNGTTKSAMTSSSTGVTRKVTTNNSGSNTHSTESILAPSSSLSASPTTRSFSDPLNDISTETDDAVSDQAQPYSPYRASTPKPVQLPREKALDRRTSSPSYFGQSTRPSEDKDVHRPATITPFPSTPNSTNYSPQPHTAARPSEYRNTPPSSPRVVRRDSQYDFQRAKAPQYLHITIPDTDRRAKDGMFVLSVQTNMPRFKRQSYNNITRSYLEFVRLREHLVEEHPEVIVPVLPPERSLVSASDVNSMRLFLERVAKHPVLSQDYELQIFIESEFGFLPPAKPTKILGKLLNIGVKRFSSSSVQSLGDTDDEFEEERASAAKVEAKLQAVMKSLEKEIRARRDFSSKESELATLCNTWAESESLPDLARTFKRLAKPLDGIAKASKAQVGGDATVLGSFLEYRLQHVQTLSSALDYRLSVVGEYDASIKSTESKRKTMERLRSSTNINPEKVTDSIDDLEDAVLFESNMKLRMEQVSSALTKDLEGYRQQSQEDILQCLRQYSLRQIGFERSKLEELYAVCNNGNSL